MGQRVQVLVIKENKKGERKSTFFHHQWGFGRLMYMGLIDLVMSDYNKETFKKDYDFLAPARFGTNEKFYDTTNEVPRKVLEDVDPENFATIAHVFDWGDNNNGGMVVHIKENKEHDYYSSDFKVGFLLGPEDTHGKYTGRDGSEKEYNIGNDDVEFSRWLTPAEYGKMNGGSDYSDDKFIKLFTDFCEYFDVEFFENKTTPEENIKALETIRSEYEEYEKEFGDDEVPCGYGE